MACNQRYKVSVIGDGDVSPTSLAYQYALEVGKLLVDNRYIVVTGGMGGVMEAASKGGQQSALHEPGDVVGFLPWRDESGANKWLDLKIPTGLGHLRNGLVAQSDAVIAVGGCAGTLSEMCFAWIFKRLVIAVQCDGWSGELAGKRLDRRQRFDDLPNDQIFAASSASEVIDLLNMHIKTYAERNTSG